MYQSLKSDVTSRILTKARKTFESARKSAVDMYLNNMKKKQFETCQEFDDIHNQSHGAAMRLVSDIKIDGAEDIQENIVSKLKNVTLIHLIIIFIIKLNKLINPIYHFFRT